MIDPETHRVFNDALNKLLEYMDGHLPTCNGGEEAPCDCGFVDPHIVIGALKHRLVIDPPREPPLLICIDCKNTESPAGSMARYFNQGRCLHCGGYFKVYSA